jgi:hypothetical protein
VHWLRVGVHAQPGEERGERGGGRGGTARGAEERVRGWRERRIHSEGWLLGQGTREPIRQLDRFGILSDLDL